MIPHHIHRFCPHSRGRYDTGHVRQGQKLGVTLEFCLPHPIPKAEGQPGVAGAPKRERRQPGDMENM